MKITKTLLDKNSESSFSVTITPICDDMIAPAAELFNHYAENELPYKKTDPASWTKIFFDPNETVEKYLYVADADGKLAGFSGGCRNTETGACYITFVLVEKKYRRNGIGKMLLEALEQALTNRMALSEVPDKCSKLQITFFNPCALTWLIPGTSMHDHPNAPGVDITSDGFSFFIAMGYVPYVYQNSFYLPLAEYTEPASIVEKKENLLQRGISLEYYDASKHYGLAELCDDLGNPVWKEELLSNDALGRTGHPLVAAIRDNRIIAFTGPLRVQESGRGYFAGIGVHSACRGLGLGNVLFHTLCTSLKNMGAEFMTLFTGKENLAGEIYKKAGFKIVKTWADMEKEC